MIANDAQARKSIPIASGVLDYFPDALCAVAECSRLGNEQHNPGKPLHWDRSKSQDEADALVRHLMDRGTIDTDGVRHSAKVAWRALALLQKEIEASRPAPAIGLAQEIEKAAAPIQHEPHFSDKAEPGQVVPVTLIKPLIPPIDEQDE